MILTLPGDQKQESFTSPVKQLQIILDPPPPENQQLQIIACWGESKQKSTSTALPVAHIQTSVAKAPFSILIHQLIQHACV